MIQNKFKYLSYGFICTLLIKELKKTVIIMICNIVFDYLLIL